MRNFFILLVALTGLTIQLNAQDEPQAGKWKTWFISSGTEHRLPSPPSYKKEITEVISIQEKLDDAGWQRILYWNAGAPGYRWQEMIGKLWMNDTANTGPLANMLLGIATYDATIAAWDTKYAYKRPRPFAADSRVKSYVMKPESPSYPCEHSVAAGVAATIISHFYPSLTDSVNKLATQQMDSRIAAGVAFPVDTRDGFELGKQIALKEIERTKNFVPKGPWSGTVPNTPGTWNGKKPMFAQAP
ncbi:MAG TPA: phosphatase PAP2 family protein, partial [Cyclobacteriaceae bacterium]|nr:phosphatase PAP2 family protein [Cyclobacteriaceae bacterium]